jgi:hypothetical protein
MSFLISPPPMMNKQEGPMTYGPWTPDSIASAVVFWLDASVASTVELSGSSVTKWNSRIGSIYATPPTTSNRPTYSATGRNSKPALLFNGTSQRLTLSVTSGNGGVAAGGTPSCMSGVAYSSVTGWRHLLHYGGSANGSCRAIGVTNTGVVTFATSGNDLYTTTSWTNADTIPIANVKPTTLSNLWFPESATSTNGANGVTLNTTSNSVVAIGSDNAGGSLWSGAIQEVIMFNRNLTNTEVIKLQGYYAWKWGMTAKLHGAHAYKTTPPKA